MKKGFEYINSFSFYKYPVKQAQYHSPILQKKKKRAELWTQATQL
jgi:hypothetical protein